MNDPSLQGATRLADWGVIRAEGADAASFLHSQLTNDILSIDSSEARLAGYCSAKGRLLATLLVWRRGIDEILLACSADVLPATLKRLSMYVLRAKCKLSDVSGMVSLYGLAGEAATGWLGDIAPRAPWQRQSLDRTQVIRLADAAGQARYVLAAPTDEPPPALPSLDPAAWAWLEVMSATPRIVVPTVEHFVPQMVNLELVGGVSFQKGCYPGQEIVARSQYRGTLKRRAFLFEAESTALPGQEVFAADDPSQPAGMVVNAASLGSRHAALVEAKIACADAQLHLGSAEGPRLRRIELPYALPIHGNQ